MPNVETSNSCKDHWEELSTWHFPCEVRLNIRCVVLYMQQQRMNGLSLLKTCNLKITELVTFTVLDGINVPYLVTDFKSVTHGLKNL